LQAPLLVAGSVVPGNFMRSRRSGIVHPIHSLPPLVTLNKDVMPKVWRCGYDRNPAGEVNSLTMCRRLVEREGHALLPTKQRGKSGERVIVATRRESERFSPSRQKRSA
jgi:hypothetical protein